MAEISSINKASEDVINFIETHEPTDDLIIISKKTTKKKMSANKNKRNSHLIRISPISNIILGVSCGWLTGFGAKYIGWEKTIEVLKLNIFLHLADKTGFITINREMVCGWLYKLEVAIKDQIPCEADEAVNKVLMKTENMLKSKGSKFDQLASKLLKPTNIFVIGHLFGVAIGALSASMIL